MASGGKVDLGDAERDCLVFACFCSNDVVRDRVGAAQFSLRIDASGVQKFFCIVAKTRRNLASRRSPDGLKARLRLASPGVGSPAPDRRNVGHAALDYRTAVC